MDIHIGEMLARNGRMYPDEVALVERNPAEKERREITWGEFDRAADRFSQVLTKEGIKKGDRVIHLMTNSIDWLIAYFGILRTGAWVVPLNFRFTSEDIKYCAEVAEGSIMIFGPEFLDRVGAIKDELPTIGKFIFAGEDAPGWSDPFAGLMEQTATFPLDTPLSFDDPCGLYFTSGTTGRPKPILLSHKNMACASITENMHHLQTRRDNFICIPPLYHTGAKMHWFGNLIVGSRSVLLKGVSPEWIFEAVSEEGGTIVWLLVPWVQDILVKLDKGELRIEDYALSQWRLMHIGAMPVPPTVIRRWKSYFPNMDYDTTYGLSESTGPNCFHLGLENLHKVGAIGKPGFNWEARIVDHEDQDVSPGEPGNSLSAVMAS